MNWSQLRTIIWLRWRLSRNQWSRGGTLNAVLTIIITFIGLGIGLIGGIVGLLVGIFALSKASPSVMLIVWDMLIGFFLFFWLAGIVSEIQRSETIDISRLLHLPISLRNVFIINYLASHLTPSIILFLPAMLGLSLGLILGGRGFMVLMFPLVLGLIFMVTAWTYCLRGWLVTIMMNKRRRRTIIAGVTFAFILLSQIPYIVTNLTVKHDHHKPKITESVQPEQKTTDEPKESEKLVLPNGLLLAHKVVPFLWVGNGAMSLATGNALPAVLGAAGGFLLGGLGLRRAYRSTIRFYQGQTVGKNAKRKPKTEKLTKGEKNLIEKQLPWIPEEAAASAMAFFRCLMRAPEVKMMLGTNFIMLLIFGTMIFVRRSANIGDNFKPLIATGAVGFMCLGLSQLMYNQFGFDRSGFRRLVLLPSQRKQILLGKNLAFLPLVLGIGATLLLFVKLVMGISFIITIAGFLQLLAAFFMLSLVGNLMSILVPYRIAAGSLKPTKSSTKTTVLIFISRMFFPMIMAPIFFPPAIGLLFSKVGWLPANPVNLVSSAVLMAFLALFYWLSLNPLGELLQRREKQILEVVTKEIE
jgi:ABC-2 type transport system permease protein